MSQTCFGCNCSSNKPDYANIIQTCDRFGHQQRLQRANITQQWMCGVCFRFQDVCKQKQKQNRGKAKWE